VYSLFLILLFLSLRDSASAASGNIISIDCTCVCPTSCYSYRVVSHKAFQALRLFSDLLFVTIWVLIIPDSLTTALYLKPAETTSSEAGRNVARNSRGFYLRSISDIFCKIFFKCLKILWLPLRWMSGYGLLSPLKMNRPRPALNLRNLGPIVSTITTRPPMATGLLKFCPYVCLSVCI
jgi:hypothetical protein